MSGSKDQGETSISITAIGVICLYGSRAGVGIRTRGAED